VKFISVSNKNTSKSFIFLTNNYITDAFTVEKIHSIYMGRGEILPLSYNPNVIASDTVCPVCNMREQENILAEGRRTTAPIAVVTRSKTPSFATKNARNLEADPGARALSKSSSWRFFLVCNRSAEILDNWST